MTNIEFLSIQVELQEKVLGRWLPCQVGGKFIAERTHIKTPDKKYALKSECIHQGCTILKIWSLCSCAPKGILYIQIIESREGVRCNIAQK